MSKPKILVHLCCAPDALYVMEVLKKDFSISGYFYNPNIHPREEYDLREKETRNVADLIPFKLYTGEYDDKRWFTSTHKFRSEPEKGRRCDICYALRLQSTARKASALDLDYFTTVMSLSPWKKSEVLNKIGNMFAYRYGVRFLEANFKKKDGFHKSIELSKKHNLYRQNYCGCMYSKAGK